LGASAILEGSVRRSTNRIRVTAQLIGAADGCHLWGERYDRELTEVFTIQEEISGSIIDALQIRLAGKRPLVKPQTTNPEAYQLWLMGRFHTQRQTPNQILRSRSCFEQAVAIDPRFPQAHVGIAESWWECASFGLERPKEAVAIGRYAISRALELDPSSGDALSMLGIYSGVHDFDWPAAERCFKRALELDPASPDIHRRYAAYPLEPTNRLAEACAELETALDLDPLSPVVLAYLGQCIMFERRFDEAEERLREAVEIDPSYWMTHFLLAGASAFQGQFEKSLATAEAALRSIGFNPIVLGAAGSMYGILGQRARAEECLARLQATGEIRYVSPLSIAWVHLGLQNVENCLDWLEKAVNEREPQIIHFAVKPMYDAFRAHPRFQALLRKMRLGSETVQLAQAAGESR